jgi:hypothetical protein
MATVLSPQPESRTVLNGVPWRTYLELRENPDNDHLRMTYDRGTLAKDSHRSLPWPSESGLWNWTFPFGVWAR